ncbi:MAG: DUF362 domain-containing protein [Acidobacteriota bacterium]
MSKSKVAVIRTTPQKVLEDYSRVMRMTDYLSHVDRSIPTIIKLNLSWTKYFPACSSQPWQLDGVLKTLLEDGFSKQGLIPVENKTVVTNPWKGARDNRWLPVLERYGIKFTPLTEVKWIVYKFKTRLFRLNQLFPEGIEIPELMIGKNVIHLPTVKTHGHSVMTGAIKNAFGGLLKEFRHYGHKYIHEVLADLMVMQMEIHPSIFAVMDGTVCGDGAGPRTMFPVTKGFILASTDSVAIDAVAAKMMGFDPMKIGYIRICHEEGFGTGNPAMIEVVGEDITSIDFGFQVRRSFVIWGDQMLRLGSLRFLEKIALHSPLVFWAPMASNIYHDFLWYPTIGKSRIRKFKDTEWGRLFSKY